jgi:vacuole morphology and inheritance protein 14
MYRTVAALSTRSKLVREEIKWQELLSHFRTVQAKHEKTRRQAMGGDIAFTESSENDKFNEGGAVATGTAGTSSGSGRPQFRRKVTGDMNPPTALPRPGILSPLNPKARNTAGSAPPSTSPQAAGRSVSPVIVR